MVGAPARIVVFRALQLGDLLVAVPALRALRRAFPHARITLAGLPWARSFVSRFTHVLDDFLEFPGWPGLPEIAVDVRKVPRFLKHAQASAFDLALQLHGSGSIVNEIVMLLDASRTAGFHEETGLGVGLDLFTPSPETGNEIERCLQLTDHLGVARAGTWLEFPLTEDDQDAFHELEPAAGLVPRRYVCVHPGSRLPSRRWPAERFAQIADRIADHGYRVVLTGTADDADVTAAVLRRMHRKAIDLTGRTSLGSLGVLLSRARLLLSNDTGVSHIAAALRIPSVVICSGADPARWSPLDADLHRVLFHPVACRPCGHEICPIGHPCAHGVDVASVWREVERMLSPARQTPEPTTIRTQTHFAQHPARGARHG